MQLISSKSCALLLWTIIDLFSVHEHTKLFLSVNQTAILDFGQTEIFKVETLEFWPTEISRAETFQL